MLAEENSLEVAGLEQQDLNWFKDMLTGRRAELLGEAGRTGSMLKTMVKLGVGAVRA